MATANKSKPDAKAKTEAEVAKIAPSTGDLVLDEGAAGGANVTGDATQPDEVSESARLGGSTVENLKADVEVQVPPVSLSEADSSGGEMRLFPGDAVLLVGNTYTAEVQLPKSFNELGGDVVTFMHPAGWDVKAAVNGYVATGTFLIERPRQFNFGFKLNGKKIASASYETRDA